MALKKPDELLPIVPVKPDASNLNISRDEFIAKRKKQKEIDERVKKATKKIKEEVESEKEEEAEPEVETVETHKKHTAKRK